MRVSYGKLVRDRIPEIIESHGHHVVTHVLDDDSYCAALLAKLAEEVHEAQSATANDLPDELADVLEVLQGLTAALGMTWKQLQELADDKRTHRGGFQQRLFLDYVDRLE
jgi:predicted house-cleaning noncanonical NTP pyrophosphatase (MazG superfamily)